VQQQQVDFYTGLKPSQQQRKQVQSTMATTMQTKQMMQATQEVTHADSNNDPSNSNSITNSNSSSSSQVAASAAAVAVPCGSRSFSPAQDWSSGISGRSGGAAALSISSSAAPVTRLAQGRHSTDTLHSA